MQAKNFVTNKLSAIVWPETANESPHGVAVMVIDVVLALST